MKICNKCKRELPKSCFYKNKRNKDGLASQCKRCICEYQKKYREENIERIKERVQKHYYENKEKILEYQKKYSEENKQKISETKQEYYKKNKEKILAKSKKWSVDNKERKLKTKNEYYQKNRKRIIEYQKEYEKTYAKTPAGKEKRWRAKHRRRSLERRSITTLTQKQWEKIIKEQKNTCAICKKPFSKDNLPTKDHIIPITKGGDLTMENIQALCHSCNCKKGNKVPLNKIVSWITKISSVHPSPDTSR